VQRFQEIQPEERLPLIQVLLSKGCRGQARQKEPVAGGSHRHLQGLW